jgi:hypothetical protein
MATTHGKGAAFWLDNAAGSLVNLSAFCDTVDVSQSVDNAEDTTYSTAAHPAKGYLPGLKDATISIGGPWSGTLDRHMDAMLGRTGTYEAGPDGSAPGDVRYTAEGILTEYSGAIPVGDKITWTATIQSTGTLTRNTY